MDTPRARVRCVAIALLAAATSSASAAMIETPSGIKVDAPDGWVMTEFAKAVRPIDTRGGALGSAVAILHPADKPPGELPYAVLSEKPAAYAAGRTEVEAAAQIAHGLFGGGEVLPREGPSFKLANASSRSPLDVSEYTRDFSFDATYDAGKPTARRVAVRSRFVPIRQIAIAVWSDAASARLSAADIERMTNSLDARELTAPAPKKQQSTLDKILNSSRLVILVGVVLVAILSAIARRWGSGDEPKDAMP